MNLDSATESTSVGMAKLFNELFNSIFSAEEVLESEDTLVNKHAQLTKFKISGRRIQESITNLLTSPRPRAQMEPRLIFLQNAKRNLSEF